MKQPTPTYLAAAVAAFNLVTRNSLSERDAALFMHLADTARERHASPPISRLEPEAKEDTSEPDDGWKRFKYGRPSEECCPIDVVYKDGLTVYRIVNLNAVDWKAVERWRESQWVPEQPTQAVKPLDSQEPEPLDFNVLANSVSVASEPRPIINQHTVIMPRHPVKAVDLPNTDALVDPTGRPRWDDVPAWIKWLAQNRRGVWKGFASKPEAKCGDWVSTKRFAEINSGTPLIGQDWISTLEPRP